MVRVDGSRREYDAEHQRKIYQDFRKRRDVLYLLFGNHCYLCESEKRSSFHFHHRSYDPVESSYPRHSKTMNVRIKRLKEVEANPERFTMLCPRCHQAVTALEGRMIDIQKLKELL